MCRNAKYDSTDGLTADTCLKSCPYVQTPSLLLLEGRTPSYRHIAAPTPLGAGQGSSVPPGLPCGCASPPNPDVPPLSCHHGTVLSCPDVAYLIHHPHAPHVQKKKHRAGGISGGGNRIISRHFAVYRNCVRAAINT